jgi:type II secretory pathway pseudopilin PulG
MMSHPPPTCRRGFTLFQLLLLLALLAILLGLLLPAVQKVRDAARRSQDSNNLKQICLATINCADTNNGTLPPVVGWYPNKDATTPNNGYGTLFFLILPYIEQDNLYKSALDDGKYRVDAGGVRGMVVKTYVSPSDPGTGKDLIHDGWLAKSNYAANFLVFGNPAKESLDGDSKFPASIPDGTSNTILFAQRYQTCNGDLCAWGYDGGTAWVPAFAYLNQGKFQARPAAAQCDAALAQGLQAQGIEVGMGDGSTRFVASTISPQTWWAACTPAGGEVLGPDW